MSAERSSAASRACGVSYRQLDYWTTLGYLYPAGGLRNPGSGRPRQWHDHELRVASMIWALKLAGLELPAAAAAARKVCAGQPQIELAPGIWLTVQVPA